MGFRLWARIGAHRWALRRPKPLEFDIPVLKTAVILLYFAVLSLPYAEAELLLHRGDSFSPQSLVQPWRIRSTGVSIWLVLFRAVVNPLHADLENNRNKSCIFLDFVRIRECLAKYLEGRFICFQG